MFPISWPRWIAARFEGNSRRRRRARQLSRPLLLELLEERDLLSVATPDSDVAPIFGPDSNGYTPRQIRQAYGFNQIGFNGGTVKGDGSGQIIAIVDAYNDPNIANDLYAFDQRFGLNNPAFTILNQNGGVLLPDTDPSGEWEAEESLDVEWAHAMAPAAGIVLVEANSDSLADLLSAVRTAAALPGVSVVSMSWGQNELLNETNFDSYFTTPAGHNGVTFVAASGDNGAPPTYPAVSPNVLAVGGTTLTTDAQGNYVGESAWSGSGGGISAYEAQPAYQKGVVSQSATQRTSPDVAYNANPANGFAVYDSFAVSGENGPWLNIGGTSAGAPQWAALVAIANQGRALNGQGSLDGPTQTLPMIYQMPGSNFHDITTGASTGTPSYAAGPGYDLATGRGSPFANQVVNYLVNGLPSSPPPGSSPSPSPSPSPPPINLIQDGDFSQPNVGPNQVVDPGGTPWNFVGQAGIAGNGAFFPGGNAPAPGGGLQFAFIYGQSSILQLVNLVAGSYTLNFQIAQVGTVPGNKEQVEVLVNNLVVALVTPGPSFTTYTSEFTVPSTGTYGLQFVGLNPSSGNAVLIDDVSLESNHTTSPGSPSDPSPSPSSDFPLPPITPGPSVTQLPSTTSTDNGSSVPGGQLAQDDMQALFQAVISSWYNLLNQELLLLEAEWNQLLLLVQQWQQTAPKT